MLKQQVAYFQETFANSSLVGGNQVVPINKDDYIHKADLDKFKLELIQKINQRFLTEEKKDEVIEREEKQFDCKISNNDDDMIFADPMETIAADLNKKRRGAKRSRSRVNSGQLTHNEESFCSTDDAEKVFVLERDSQSHRGKGYFFLALMFGMMCASSY